jgi:hypothetical protein
VVGRALAELSERYQDWESLKIGQVYLTQSDQPLAEFVGALPQFFPLVEGLTVTAAVGDPVLGMARMTDLSEEHYQQLVGIMNSDKMVFIDLRDVPATEYRFTHGAWYDSSWVSTDVMVTLLGGLNAEERGLEPLMVNDVRVWIFPDDYLDRVKENILNRPEESRKVARPGS